MITLAHRIFAAGVGPALFGFGITLLLFLYVARRLGKLHEIRRYPVLAGAIFGALYIFSQTASTKPPPDPPDPEPEPSEEFVLKVWRDADGRLLLVQSPVWEIIP